MIPQHPVGIATTALEPSPKPAQHTGILKGCVRASASGRVRLNVPRRMPCALRRAPRAVQRPSLVPTLLRAVPVASLCACPAASAVAWPWLLPCAVGRSPAPGTSEIQSLTSRPSSLMSHAARHSGVVRGCTCWCVREYVPALVLMQ